MLGAFMVFWGRAIARAFGLLLAGLVAMGATPLLADAVLMRGDTVKVSIAGLSHLDFEATVRAEGQLDLAWLGFYEAEGRLPSDVEEEVRANAAGEIIKQYDRDGEIFIIQLEASQVDLTLSRQRPVIVSGDVVANGQIDYKPGLTVRDVVALSGGLDNPLRGLLLVPRQEQIISWRASLTQASIEHAHALARVWRTSMELGEEPEDMLPAQELLVPDDLLESIIAEQRRIMETNQRTEEGDLKYFEDAIAQARQRIDILLRQQEQQASAVATDEAEEERTRKLVQDGLAPSSRLADIRRNTVASATRLLDLEEALAAAGLALTGLERERVQQQELRRLELLTQRDAAQTEATQARIRMDNFRQYLSSVGGYALELLMSDPDYTATIFRRHMDEMEEFAAEKSTELWPGDTVEIKVIRPEEIGALFQ